MRFANGPEFIAHAIADWCRFNGTGSLLIDPGSPWQNAWIESFNGHLPDALATFAPDQGEGNSSLNWRLPTETFGEQVRSCRTRRLASG